MTLSELDSLTIRDFENGATRDAIRRVFKACADLVREARHFRNTHKDSVFLMEAIREADMALAGPHVYVRIKPKAKADDHRKTNGA